ncbi:hypothetical protein C0Q70_03030 [Pomacea canaliculata]|uniref:Uncharacterized protein n=1 Tax=Pomacea canaliculata TaxID=400727 RepID=A0A2T7PRP2_POMCA|nr:hypothetical protein C0Q70_03030 [Pomacea canaliculata]
MCYWCSGVGADRECERHPFAVRTGPIYINCRSRFCITAKVTDANTGEVHSFARLCDNIPHGNQCVQDSRLLTCYESCTEDLCNNGNPGPHYLPTINYARNSNSDNNNNVIELVSESKTTKKGGKERDISRGENRTFADNWRSKGTKMQETFFGNPDGNITDNNDDNGDTGGVHDRRLNGKGDLVQGGLFGDYMGNDTYDDALEETRPGASSGRQEESNAASVSFKMEDVAPEHPDQGDARKPIASKHSSPPGASKDRESFNAIRKSQGMPTFTEPTSPVESTREHEERLEHVFPLRKTDDDVLHYTSKGNDFSFQKWRISTKKFPELNSKSFGKGEEWIFSPDQGNAPLFNAESISRKLAPMVMDKHPSAYIPSQKLQDQVQVAQNNFVVDASETFSNNNPRSYDLTTFGPRTLSHEELSSSLQSKPEYLYLLSHLRARSGKDDSKWFSMKNPPEMSTPHPSYWSHPQTYHPSVSPYFYSRKMLTPVFNAQSPFDQSWTAVSLDLDPTSFPTMLHATTTPDYPQELSLFRSPDTRIFPQLSVEDPIPLQQSLNIPKSNSLFSAQISSFPYNNSLLSYPGGSRPKIDSYSVFQTKQREDDLRFPPNAESQGGEYWGSEDLAPENAFVETGYKMDSLDDIVSAFRQHPVNRYSTANPLLQPSLSSATFGIPETSKQTPSLSENNRYLDSSSSFAGSGQSDGRLLPLTTPAGQNLNVSINSYQKSLLSTVSMNTASSSLIGTIAEVSSVTPENYEQLFSSSTAADHGLSLLAITSAMDFLVETSTKHGISPQTKLREESTITENIHNLSATDDEFKLTNNDQSEFRNPEQNISDDATIVNTMPVVSEFLLNSSTGIGTWPSTLESPLVKLYVNRAPVNLSSSLHTILLPEGQSARRLKASDTEVSVSTLSQEELTEKVKHAEDISPMNVQNSKDEGNKVADASVLNNFQGREAASTAGIQKPLSDHSILKMDVLNTSNPSTSQVPISDGLITTLQSKQTGDRVSSVSDTNVMANISGNSKNPQTVKQDFSSRKNLTNKQYNSSTVTRVPQQFSNFETNQTTLEHNRSVTTNALPVSQRQLQPRLETNQVTSASPSIEGSQEQPPTDSLEEGADDHVWSADPQEIVRREPQKELVVYKSEVNQGISAQIQPSSLVPESSTTNNTEETRESRAFENGFHEFSNTLRPDTIKPTYFLARPKHDAQRNSPGRMQSLAAGQNTLASLAGLQTTSILKVLSQGVSTALVTSPSPLTSSSPIREASKMSLGRPTADVQRVFDSEGQEINRWSHVHSEKEERNRSTRISHCISSLLAVMLTFLFLR